MHPAAWAELLDSGAVREGPTGSYYLFEPAGKTMVRLRILNIAIVWAILLAIPVLMIKCQH